MRNHFIIKRMADDSLFLIDIDKILREKAPKHVKYIPKFVVSYLKRIVHQDELNVFLRESKDKVGVEFLVGLSGCQTDSEGRGELIERRTLYLCFQSPFGRTGRGGVRLRTRYFLRWKGEIYGE